MGMHGVLVRISDLQRAAIAQNPERASCLLRDWAPIRSTPHRRRDLHTTWDALNRGLTLGDERGTPAPAGPAETLGEDEFDERWDTLAIMFGQIVRFYRSAAKRGDGMLMVVL